MRILTFGDSLTIGVTSAGGGCRTPYARALEAELRRRTLDASAVESVGWAGISSESVMNSMERHQGLLTLIRMAAEAGAPYDAVLVLLGTNDFLSGRHDSLLPNLRAMHGAIQDAGTASIALGLPQSRFSEQTPERSEALRTLNTQISACGASLFVDVAAMLPYEEGSGIWSEDGVHMTPAGYHALGTALVTPLLQVLRLDERRGVE